MADTLTGFPDFFRYAVWQLLQTCGGNVGSGSRTNEEQASLYASKGAWSPSNPGAAAPGTSNHEVGVGNGAADMEGDLDCMHANAAKFGLVFPMSNEPWHVEPGDELAAQGMAFFGEIPEGADPNAAQPKPEDPLERAARLLMGDEDGGDLEAPEPVQVPVDPAAAPAAATSSTFTPQASAGFTPGGGPMSAVEVAQYLAAAGFRGDDLVKAVAISRGESGWDPGATGDTSLVNGTWGPSMGLMQVRSINAENGRGTWRDGSRLHDPAFNAKAAFAIYNDAGQTFTDWTVFNKGIYTQWMAEAQAAVAAIGGGMGAAPPATPEVPAETQELDDLLAARQDPADMLEGMEGGDIINETIGQEVDPELAPESFASA